jgi:hypothetical protein
MNWGIPLLLMGNPKALEEVRTFTQDSRRFSIGHWFTFEPSWSSNSPEWRNDLAPQLGSWTVLPEADEPKILRPSYLWSRTGGVPGFLFVLRFEALKHAIDRGGRRVTESDIDKAFNGRAMKPNHALIKALVNRDVGALGALTDVSVDRFAERWKELAADEARRKSPSALDSSSEPMAMEKTSDSGKPGDSDGTPRVGAPSVTPSSTLNALESPQTGTTRKLMRDRKSLAPPLPRDVMSTPPVAVDPQPTDNDGYQHDQQHIDRREIAFRSILGARQNRKK